MQHPTTELICYINGYKGLLLGESIKVCPAIRATASALHQVAPRALRAAPVGPPSRLRRFARLPTRLRPPRSPAAAQHGGSPIGNSRVKLTNIKDCLKRGLVKEGQDPQQVAADQLIADGEARPTTPTRLPASHPPAPQLFNRNSSTATLQPQASRCCTPSAATTQTRQPQTSPPSSSAGADTRFESSAPPARPALLPTRPPASRPLPPPQTPSPDGRAAEDDRQRRALQPRAVAPPARGPWLSSTDPRVRSSRSRSPSARGPPPRRAPASSRMSAPRRRRTRA